MHSWAVTNTGHIENQPKVAHKKEEISNPRAHTPGGPLRQAWRIPFINQQDISFLYVRDECQGVRTMLWVRTNR